ncbi:alpha/beta fold hydrolase [Roseateles asaccharophilus]|uniref:Pimeloyl-ACP methyl ester carboxylesterase n=1 Tax=Roseateles asaccharophilus TaxID=582607 RepID=A0ABU2AEW1_9BURK|nr:alpha/beta fold hydrolase [Roseateles asaccharophilus]MDR7335736.1 pimeloyl-ACP methyl ester carboxylesterase [Roseateles asaccharophilus]
MSSSNLWTDVSARLALEEEPTLASTLPIGQRRRRAAARDADGRAQVELVRDDDGLLRWVYTPPTTPGGTGRRAYRSMRVAPDDVVQRFRFNDFGANAVTDKLIDADDWLTPDQRMQRWQDGHLVDDVRPRIDKGRVLLLVHGTFSKSKMWFDELQATEAGRKLLAGWQQKYSAILAFGHPTLSVAAWSNALDLHAALQDVSAPIDVVCHSRGGLVVGWLMRLRAVPVERVVFVASPLVGTSLAAPDKLRAALDMIASYADAVSSLSRQATGIVPFAEGVSLLAKIFGKVLQLGSNTPIVDAAVGLVPGLATQQLTKNNNDVRQLFAAPWLSTPKMYGIGAAFQPDESTQPMWRFWRRFSNIGDQVKYGAADLVFPGPNDLVVDVDSMFRLGEGGNLTFEALGVGPTTHHTNYFRDERVIGYLGDQFSSQS